jgi:integrase/recombinase XerC
MPSMGTARSNGPLEAMVVKTVGTVATLEEGVVTRYAEHMRMRNLRPWTIYSRRRALARLAIWAESPILYLTEADLVRWQTQRCRELQPEPLRTDMSHHRQFYRWCVRENFITIDPTARLDLPRVSRRLPRPIEDLRLLEAMAGAPDDVRVALALAGFAGFRAMEIAGLDWSEISTGTNPQIRIAEGKGGHTRILPLSDALAAELHTLPHRRGPVIPRRDGLPGRCAPHRISSMVNDYLHEAGFVETLHQARHRFGTSTYRACQDIRAVMDLMGHASPSTTAIYAAASSTVARAAVDAAGSLAA